MEIPQPTHPFCAESFSAASWSSSGRLISAFNTISDHELTNLGDCLIHTQLPSTIYFLIFCTWSQYPLPCHTIHRPQFCPLEFNRIIQFIFSMRLFQVSKEPAVLTSQHILFLNALPTFSINLRLTRCPETLKVFWSPFFYLLVFLRSVELCSLRDL